MRAPAPRFLVACAAGIVALSCGDVPTLADGIAFIAPIDLPSPAVAAGDTLRDSLGKAAPLRVTAHGRDNSVIPNVSATFLVTTVPAGVKVDANGIVTAFDSLRTVRIVARIGDRLQTTETSLEVVAQPDSMAVASPLDSLAGMPGKQALQVSVTGPRRGSRIPVNGVIVRYQIVAVNGRSAIDSLNVFLVDDAGAPLRNSVTRAIDTTQSGVASRMLTVANPTGVTTIEVLASARSLRGQALKGSPLRFTVPVKKGP